MKYVLAFYLDKHDFIATWKAWFKFQILSPSGFCTRYCGGRGEVVPGHWAPSHSSYPFSYNPWFYGSLAHAFNSLHPNATPKTYLLSWPPLGPKGAHTSDIACPQEEVGLRPWGQRIPASQVLHDVEIEAWILGRHISLTDVKGLKGTHGKELYHLLY